MTQRVATINNNQSLLVPWEKFKVNYMLTFSKIKGAQPLKKVAVHILCSLTLPFLPVTSAE